MKKTTIKPSEYVIAIPSYKRSLTISNRTLKVLKEKKVNSNRIYIFVANEEEQKLYQKDVSKKLYREIVVGVIGLRDQRNFITKYFPENTCIVECDDDIKEISSLVPGKGKTRAERQKANKLKSIINVDLFFKEAFQRLIIGNTNLGSFSYTQGNHTKAKCYMWGVYPVFNPYFLSNKITLDLQFLVGPMWGKINRHDKTLQLKLNEKEDFERTLRHYHKDGAVMRFWNITINTPYYKEPGGMQAENKDRYKEAEISANFLVKKFPKYTEKWYKGKTKRPEIKLKDTTLKKVVKKNKS